MKHSRYQFIPAMAAALVLSSIPLSAQTLLFDFGGANTTAFSVDDPVNYWNNIDNQIATVNGAQLANAVTISNQATEVDLVITGRFNSANENGTQASTIYPLDATRDAQYGHTGPWGSVNSDLFPSFKLTGLKPTDSVDLNFYASRAGVGDNRETDYTITGAATAVVSLNPANNVDTTVTAGDIIPDAAGEITIALSPGVNNNNANRFTYLGVLRVDITTVQVPIVFSDEPDDTTVILGRPVTFTAAVNSSPPYMVQWMKNGEDIPGENGFSYTIPMVTPDLHNSKYSVRVSNLQFSGTSRQATLTVNPDNTPPALVSAVSTGPGNLTLLFSEELDPFPAADTMNYAVDGGAVFLLSATLQADRKTVILTPGSPLASPAQIIPSGLMDLAGNFILASPGLTVSVPQPDGRSLLIDFGGGDTTTLGNGNDDPLNVWNNVSNGLAAVDGSSLADLLKNNGEVTPVSLTIVSRFNGTNATGTLTSGVFPADATRDSLFGNTGLFQNLENITPIIRLGGLNQAEVYDMVFYASRSDTGTNPANRTTRYTASGATVDFAELNIANNTSGSVTIAGMRPDGNGNITIALTPGASNTTAELFTYLGLMKFTPRAATGPLEMLTPVVSEGRITLNWIGSGNLEWSTQLLQGTWNPILPAPAPPYSEDIVPGQRKFFRLRP